MLLKPAGVEESFVHSVCCKNTSAAVGPRVTGGPTPTQILPAFLVTNLRYRQGVVMNVYPMRDFLWQMAMRWRQRNFARTDAAEKHLKELR